MLSQENITSFRPTTYEIIVQRFALVGGLVVLSFANSFLLLLRPLSGKQYRFFGVVHVPAESYDFLERLRVLVKENEISGESFHPV